MDTLKEYKKMCRSAKEIQKLHKPKEGDFWICKCDSCIDDETLGDGRAYIIDGYDIVQVEKRDLSGHSTGFKQILKLMDDSFYQFYKGELSGHYTWLPRQDQLQEILKTKLQLYSDRGLLNLLNIFCDNNLSKNLSLSVDEIRKMSMEQLWLAFVMCESFNKIWNDKTEEWEAVK